MEKEMDDLRLKICQLSDMLRSKLWIIQVADEETLLSEGEVILNGCWQTFLRLRRRFEEFNNKAKKTKG